MAAILGAGTLMPNNSDAAGELRVTYGNGADSSTIRFVENSINSGPFIGMSGFQTFVENGGNTYFRVKVDNENNNRFECPLQFSSIADGTPNSLIYQFYSFNPGSSRVNTNTFPSNILITSRNVSQGYTNFVDVIKETSNNGSVTNNMPVSVGGANGIVRHGTSTLLFTLKDSAIPRITTIRKNGSLVDLVVTNVLAGEQLTPESSSNLSNWVSDKSRAVYIPVTFDSFGKPTSAAILNVPASDSRMFYRVKVE